LILPSKIKKEKEVVDEKIRKYRGIESELKICLIKKNGG